MAGGGAIIATAAFSVHFRYLWPSREPLYCAPFVVAPTGESVSKQDTHFLNMFSLVLGLLIGIAILLVILAKLVGSATQAQHVKTDPLQLDAIGERTQPFARVAVAGQDNSALAIAQVSEAGSAPALAVPQNAEELFNTACTACHGQGIAGAPKMGDRAAWAPRIAQGKETLYKHALEGFQGKAGVMPPKGGRVDLPDDLVRQGVDYMVEHAQ